MLSKKQAIAWIWVSREFCKLRPKKMAWLQLAAITVPKIVSRKGFNHSGILQVRLLPYIRACIRNIHTYMHAYETYMHAYETYIHTCMHTKHTYIHACIRNKCPKRSNKRTKQFVLHSWWWTTRVARLYILIPKSPCWVYFRAKKLKMWVYFMAIW
jgi:hypothetical protein